MRISDWSSDVCSSDLAHAAAPEQRFDAVAPEARARRQRFAAGITGDRSARGEQFGAIRVIPGGHGHGAPPCRQQLHGNGSRSEEHTSELQSLMRISYAVVCLKKKNTHTTSQQRGT